MAQWLGPEGKKEEKKGDWGMFFELQRERKHDGTAAALERQSEYRDSRQYRDRGDRGERRFGDRGGRGGQWQDQGRSKDEELSHKLARILRHRASDIGLQADPEGFVLVADLLSLREFSGARAVDLCRVAETSESRRGKRFELEGSGDSERIRSLYTHEGERRRGDEQRDELRSREARRPQHFTQSPSSLPETFHIASDSEESRPVAPSSAALEKCWARYLEPEAQRVWFWNSVSEEIFFADSAAEHGWECFRDEAGRTWWWHESTGRHFFEHEMNDGATTG